MVSLTTYKMILNLVDPGELPFDAALHPGQHDLPRQKLHQRWIWRLVEKYDQRHLDVHNRPSQIYMYGAKDRYD